jgi:hypothetical protein
MRTWRVASDWRTSSTQLSDARMDFQQDAAVGGTIGGPLGSPSAQCLMEPPVPLPLPSLSWR